MSQPNSQTTTSPPTDRSAPELQGDCWESGSGAPSVPTPTEVTDLLEEADRSPGEGGIVSRLELESPDRDLMYRAREQLLAEDAILATSVGCPAGPVNPRAFDVLVEGGYDLSTIGRTFTNPAEVVGVTTATVDGILGAEGSDDGDPDGSPEADHAADHSQAVIDEQFAELREEIDRVPLETLQAELDRQGFGDEAVDMATLLGEATHPESAGQEPPADDAALDERIPPVADAGEEAALDERIPPVDDAGDEVADADGGPADAAVADRLADLEAKLTAVDARLDQLESDRGADDDFEDRLRAVETTVESLAEWREQLEAALLGESA
jgi:hypothetical protein